MSSLPTWRRASFLLSPEDSFVDIRFWEKLIRKSLSREPPIPGKPSQLFYSLHTPPLNPVISPKEHFFRHIQCDLRASALADGTSSRPSSLTDLHPVPPRPALVTFFCPKNPFFWAAPSPTVVRPLYTLAGTRQLQRRRPVVGPQQRRCTTGWVEEESPTFRYHEPQRTSIPDT